MNTIVREQGLISTEPTADQRGWEGYFVKWNGAGKAMIANSVLDDPLGVIVDGEDVSGRSTVAMGGAFAGVVKVKAQTALPQGAFLVLSNNGKVIADPGIGARRRVARALQAGSADDLIDAILMTPLALT